MTAIRFAAAKVAYDVGCMVSALLIVVGVARLFLGASGDDDAFTWTTPVMFGIGVAGAIGFFVSRAEKRRSTTYTMRVR